MAKKATLSGIARTLKAPLRKKPIITEKLKVTLMMDSKLIVLLERAVLKMKDMNPKHRGQINKSLMVELALSNALQDLTKLGKDSQIYKDTESRITINTDFI